MKSKIIIVDAEDNVIGLKEQGILEVEDIYRVSALWITNSREEILLARRSFRKSHDPGKWGPAVAGTVEEGETYDLNIIKEMEEELGLKNIKPERGFKKRVFGKHNYFCQWYLLTLDKSLSEFEIQEDEVAEIKWFSKEDLIREVHNKPNEFLATTKQWIKLFC